jgi:hypothetical protein
MNGQPSHHQAQTQAQRLFKHRQGVATRLKAIEAAVEDLTLAVRAVLAEKQPPPKEQR